MELVTSKMYIEFDTSLSRTAPHRVTGQCLSKGDER